MTIVMERITRNLIAPCGMNCGVCMAYLREKNRCNGCGKVDESRSKTIVFCKIRLCRSRKRKYCFDCAKFPCDRLKHMDKRYRTKYCMSEIENLEFIRSKGINSFVKSERKRWQKGNKVFCVHKKKYF